VFFSVIVPIYKVEKYLNECVNSILSQSFKDFELILVDDGSPDNCPDICDEYVHKDTRVKVIHKENGGLSDARNAGMKESTGKYIIFIDSDDYVTKEYFLQAVYDKCDNNADIVLYKFIKYYEEEKRLEKCNYNFPKDLPDQKTSTVINALVMNDAFYCSAWSKCVKASLLKENKIEFEKGLLGEDQEWYYHVVMVAKTYEMIDEPFIAYRQRSGSITKSSTMKNLTDCLYVLEKWSGYVKNSNMDGDLKDALNGSLAKLFCNILITYSSLRDKNKKTQLKRIKSLTYLLEYTQNRRTRLTAKVYNLIGLNDTVFAMKVLNKIKK